MWAQQAALCSRKSEEQLGASQRDRQLQAEGGWAHSTSTVDLSASLLLAGLQFVDHSTNDTFENTDLDCSPFSSVPFHRQELPLNCRAGNLKKKKPHKIPGNSKEKLNPQCTSDIKGSKERKRIASTPASQHWWLWSYRSGDMNSPGTPRGVTARPPPGVPLTLGRSSFLRATASSLASYSACTWSLFFSTLCGGRNGSVSAAIASAPPYLPKPLPRAPRTVWPRLTQALCS